MHGPRGPRPLYYMLPYHLRVYGLTHTLSVKFVQDDLHVVSDLELATPDPEQLLSLATARGWSESVLFVDTEVELETKVHMKVRNHRESPYWGLLLLVESDYFCFHI